MSKTSNGCPLILAHENDWNLTALTSFIHPRSSPNSSKTHWSTRSWSKAHINSSSRARPFGTISIRLKAMRIKTLVNRQLCQWLSSSLHRIKNHIKLLQMMLSTYPLGLDFGLLPLHLKRETIDSSCRRWTKVLVREYLGLLKIDIFKFIL
jgi:hypothetical protein